jgi:hypothetical protein
MEKRNRLPLQLDASPQQKYDNLILTIYEKWKNKLSYKRLLLPRTHFPA